MYNLGSFPATYLEHGMFSTVSVKQSFSVCHTTRPSAKETPKWPLNAGFWKKIEMYIKTDQSFLMNSYCTMNNYKHNGRKIGFLLESRKD